MKTKMKEVIVASTWRTPVYVRIGFGSAEKIEGPNKALHYLMLRWPTERGLKYDQACMACANAVERTSSAEEAREAFIAGAIEASVLA